MAKAIVIMATIVALVSYVAASSAKSFIEDVTAKRNAEISAVLSK